MYRLFNFGCRVAVSLLGTGLILASPPTRALAVEPLDDAGQERISFAADVRPILADACFHCHGPDESHREADLRLDDPVSAMADLGGHAAIVPHDLEKSELWRRITSDDQDLAMPPAHSGKRLDAQSVATLKQWILQGAPYSDHWAFTAPVQVALPEVKQRSWPQGAIDTFVLARLEQKQLAPSPKADRASLIRRLSLDLIGLPPTPAEVDAFVKDESIDAEARLVERLLDSMHYGERWGRVWLDAARYADSDGFEKDKPRFVWFYRDWVVNSLNQNMPYDQFIIKQIAGDLLPGASQDDRVATGFLRNSMINEEGGVDPEQFRMEAMFDRIDAIGKAVLGLTVQCAQCHTHKYDPLSHTDYYRMFAFLNNSHESNMTVYTSREQQQRAEVQHRLADIHNTFKQTNPQWRDHMAQWEHSVLSQPEVAWQPLSLEFIAESQGGQKFLPQGDGSYLAQGYAPTKSTPSANVVVDSLSRVTAIRLELLNDPNLPHGGPGRSVDGTWALSELDLSVEQDGAHKKLKFSSVVATVDPPSQPLGGRYLDKSKNERLLGASSLAIDGNVHTAWHGDLGPGRRNDPQTAMFVLTEPLVAEAGQPLRFRIGLAQHHGGWNSDDNQTQNLGRFRLSVTKDPSPNLIAIPPRVRSILAETPEQQSYLLDYWLGHDPRWAEYARQIEEAWSHHPAGTSQLVLAERDQPRPTYRLDRGSFLSPLEAVTPGTPDFLHPLDVVPDLSSSAQPTRLDFARWLVAPQSPTAARSIVNRIWQEYFGSGLTETSDDLGLQGEPPSHPELLDWLAVDLMANGWDLKRLHRQIVMSATYQQSSNASDRLREIDPKNRLLARGPRFRVSAETVRDIALAASGLLDRTVGGPPVYPAAPAFLFEPPASYGPKTWGPASQADAYRRALYTFRFRSVPYPVYQAFDAPTGEVACVRRNLSNTPLQALTTLNEPLFLECARELADISQVVRGDLPRIEFVFRRCLARLPSDQEKEVLTDLLTQQRKRFSQETQLAADLVSNEKPGADAANPPTAAEQAAWTLLCRVLLNLDETITKE